MSNDLRTQIRNYADYLDHAQAAEAGPLELSVEARPVSARPHWARQGWLVSLAAAAIAFAIVGGGMWLMSLGETDSEVAGTTDDDTCWLYDQRPGDNLVFEVAPPPSPPDAACPEPEGRWQVAWHAMLAVLDADHFAGMWWENNMQDLVVGYVGEAPSLDDLPGVTRLVERQESLKDLDEQAEALNDAATTDEERCWTVDVANGALTCSPPNFDDFDPGL